MIKNRKFSVLIILFIVAVFIPAIPAGAQGAPRHIHLSWQHDPHTTMTVTWHTDTGLSGYTPTVRYGTTSGSYTQSATGASSTYSGSTVTVHVVELTGLTPAMKYYFICGSPGFDWSPENSFTTPPSANTGFRFCAYGDSRNPFWWPIEPQDNANFAIWEQVAQKVVSESPLFSVFSGDIVLDASDESAWNLWFDKLSPMAGIPFMSCRGNHEGNGDSSCKAYFGRFAFPGDEKTYSFDISKTHFVCLDTGLSEPEQELVDSQKAWLESDLASARARGCDWIIVFFHRPPYCAGGDHGPASDVESAWVPIFNEYGVDLVFNGHNHYYERTYPLNGGITSTEPNDYYKPGGTIYVVTGGAGAPLADTGSASYIVASNKTYHYCVIDIIPGKKLEAHVKKLDGTEIDHFSISKATPPVLTSITPSEGSVGQVITLKGSYFGKDMEGAYVSFGSVSAKNYPSWGDNEIKVQVPSGLSEGQVAVKVTTLEGTSNALNFKVVKAKAPVLTSIKPQYGHIGDTVTLEGSYFGSEQGYSYVLFGSKKASTYQSWSDTRIDVVVPSGLSYGNTNVSVTTYGGTSNSLTFEVRKSEILPSSKEWYFAEGHTGDGFQEYLCIGNPSSYSTRAKVTFIFSDGSTKELSIDIGATSRFTINVNDVVGEGLDLSAVVSANDPIVAERPIYFNYHGFASGATDTLGSIPEKEWYFAEGTTRPGFDEWITILNPGSKDATVGFEYMVRGEGEIERKEIVPAKTRRTFRVSDQIGYGKDASLQLSSTENIVAERPMYFDYSGIGAHSWRGGHCASGVSSMSMVWYFAEGTTRQGFEEWLCLANPNDNDIKVQAEYILAQGQGENIEREYVIPPKQRLTVSVNQEIGQGKDVSVKLSSTSPFIAERPVYFNYNGWCDGGHVVIGSRSLAKNWFFAEGYTGSGFEEWLCIENPQTKDAKVNITYYPQSGEPITRSHIVKASSRYTISVNLDAGSDLEISARVSSDIEVIVERPMYMNYRGILGGTCVVGTN